MKGLQNRSIRARLEILSDSLLALRASSVTDPSLANGLAGLAVTHLGLEAILPGRGHRKWAMRAMTRAHTRIGKTGYGSSFFEGFTGVAWAALRVTGTPITAVDEVLAETRAFTPDAGYDLVGGLVGIGVYALERGSQRLLGSVLRRLERLAPHRQERVNLGVAHGIPGVVAFLGLVVRARANARALAMLDDIVPWLLRVEAPRTAHAWCYGDPGFAAAIALAGRSTRKKKLGPRRDRYRVIEAAAASERSARFGRPLSWRGRPRPRFSSAFRAHGRRSLSALSKKWLARALAEDLPSDIGFLTGRAGISLSLAAALPAVDSGWDRVLLLS